MESVYSIKNIRWKDPHSEYMHLTTAVYTVWDGGWWDTRKRNTGGFRETLEARHGDS